MKIDGASVVEEGGITCEQPPAKTQRRAVLFVAAKLDEGLPERVELLQRIKRRLLRAEILHWAQILSGVPNAGDEVRVSNERDDRDDDPNQGQDGDGGEQYAASQVAACACAAGSQRGAILQ